MTLYSMTNEATKLYDLLSSEEIDEQVFNDTLEAMGTEQKIEDYCTVIRELEADAEKFKAEKERMAKNQKTAENSVKRMKKAMIDFLHATNQDKVKAGTFNVAISRSKSVVINDESLIPENYLIEQPAKIDKSGIRAAIMAGMTITGAELQENEGVRIR